MKRLSALLPSTLLLLLPWMPAAGQTTITLTAGVNRAWMESQDMLLDFLAIVVPADESTISSIDRLAAGVVVTRQGDLWGVQFRGEYSQHGARWDFYRSDPTYGIVWMANGILETDYLGLAALGRVRVPLPLREEVSIFALAGPALNREASCRMSEEGFNVDGVPSYGVRGPCDDRRSLATYRSNVDLGVSFGAEGELRGWKGFGLSAGAFYTFGLLDISGDFRGTVRQRAHSVRLGLFYTIFG
ncbi:MAG: hypothetical protein F4139_14035 [Gemmatimonadetes bacterium]|nr:hypothetical protein [Gemmatimonadota bacterium]MYA63427.1 hypothetical protein [Gemmatimonadota bacterium]MYB98928.1 hypothetical protein [Gemmatimonadota bacterium]MYH54039.1 hypothetical protein [Gemmatimonadota bacterium]MYI45352.1 hypothetical protein [Gemmatimonadota bacterium]